MDDLRTGNRMGNAALAALALACAASGGETSARVPASARPEDRGPMPARLVAELPGARPSNRPPRFLTVAPHKAQEGQGYIYDLAATDPDGDQVSFSLLQAPEGAVLDGEVLKWTPSPTQAGRRQRFTLRAVDEHGAAKLQHWSVIPGRGARPKGVLEGARMRH